MCYTEGYCDMKADLDYSRHFSNSFVKLLLSHHDQQTS